MVTYQMQEVVLAAPVSPKPVKGWKTIFGEIVRGPYKYDQALERVLEHIEANDQRLITSLTDDGSDLKTIYFVCDLT